MGISRRASRLAPMELANLLRLAAAAGATDICLGIPPVGPPPAVVDAAIGALRSGEHQYADPAGLADLRAAIAGYLAKSRGVTVDPETELTITAGATEGVFVALLTATDPGDEVVLFEPFYESYLGMVELVGAVPVIVPLRRPGWRLDSNALRAAVSSRTRAIVVNTPHNPTGRVFDAGEIEAVLAVCREHGLVCVTDEVYERYVFDGNRHVSPLGLPDGLAHAIVVGSLSKTLEITGWRVGFCVAAPETTAALRRAHERTTVGTSRPMQHGAAALRLDDLPDRTPPVQHQRDLMVAALSELGFEVESPEGGWFLLAGIHRLGRTATALARELVESAGVLVAPGTPFFRDRTEGDRWIRTTYIRDPEATAAALGRLTGHLGAAGRMG